MGILFATMIGIFMILMFYVVLQRISERKRPFAREESEPEGNPPLGGAPRDGSLSLSPVRWH